MFWSSMLAFTFMFLASGLVIRMLFVGMMPKMMLILTVLLTLMMTNIMIMMITMVMTVVTMRCSC